MQFIEPNVELLSITSNAAKLIEAAGRTCYKSEDKITDDSAEKFCEMIQTRNHMSVLEHASATFKIICDRGVTHEIVRHRIAAYSQESTRYCNYLPTKKGMRFITPAWVEKEILERKEQDAYMQVSKVDIMACSDLTNLDKQIYIFIKSCHEDEWNYNALISLGQTPQQARAVLPNCLKTEIVMTANFREWLHFLELRTAPQAHPDMQVIAKMIGNKLHEVCPAIFKKKY